MRSALRVISLAFALAWLVFSSAVAGEFAGNGCNVTWDATTVRVGNSLFSRTYVASGDDLKTKSLTVGGSELIDPARIGEVGGNIEVTAEAARRSPVGEDGVRVRVKCGNAVRVLWLFRSMAGVILEDSALVDLSAWDGTKSPYSRYGLKMPVFLKGADCLRLNRLHVLVTEFIIQDMTDVRNELVEENSWLLMSREEALVRSAPALAVEDTLSGEGVVFLRLAPLPHDRPRNEPDFLFAAYEGWKRKNCVTVAALANGCPVAEVAYSGGSVGRMLAFHSIQRALRPYRKGRDGIFLTNTWGDSNRDARINADFMMAEVKAGGELGVDVIQIDDGWQSGRSRNSALIKSRDEGTWGDFRRANPNFWKPDPVKFPLGLRRITEAAKERGMSIGLWFGPDKTEHYRGWNDDAETLLRFYRENGIRYFKIDGISMESEVGLENIRKMFDRMLVDSKGEMTFDLDVTGAVKRPGYFGVPDIGPLFVENRYTKDGGYWPHFTLRNLWMLSQVVDPIRLRMEITNPLHQDKTLFDDPLAARRWKGDALFATVMTASPLGWFEISELDPKTVAEMKPIVATWKRERERMHGGWTLPVGSAPDGVAWTGFVTRSADGKGGYALLFRELNDSAAFALDLKKLIPNATSAEVIGGYGEAELANGTLKVTVKEKLGFVWAKIH